MSAAERFDGRPVRSVSGNTLWDLATARRDKFAAVVKRILQDRAVDALVLVSQNGNYPPWVKLEAWLPLPKAPDRRERAELEFVFDERPYSEHKLVTTAKLTRGRRSIALADCVTFTEQDAAEWTQYALGYGAKPRNYTPVVNALLGLIPFVHGPHHNPVDDNYRNAFGLTGAKVLGFISAFLAYIGFSGIAAGEAVAAVALLLGVAGLIATIVIVSRRRSAIAVPSEPAARPRNLRLVDSWHTIASGIGSERQALLQGLQKQIGAVEQTVVTCAVEDYCYRTVDGYEQRERLVVGKDQSMVHVHLHQFGDDLFVGWEAFLNWAGWRETKPLTHRIEDGVDNEFRDLRPGLYVPNEFDLIDLNSLSNLVHRHIERTVRGALRERNIDQEIDFEILRGDRARSLDRSRNAPETEGSFWSRLARPGLQQRSRTEMTYVAAPAASGSAAGISARRAAIGFAIWAVVGLLGTQQLRELVYTSDLRASFGLTTIATVLGLITSSVSALAVGFGVARYAGRGLLAALGAVVATVALIYAATSAVTIGTSELMPLNEVYQSGLYYPYLALLVAGSGISVLAVASFFEPYFRDLGVWLMFLVLWIGGNLVVVWLQRSSVLSPSEAGYGFAMARALPLAAMGYWFAQAAAQRRGV